MTRETLVQLIREAGRVPVERDTLYQEVRRGLSPTPGGCSSGEEPS